MAIDLITEHIRMKLQQPELRRIYRNLELMPSNYQIRGMHTLIRDRTTSKADFVFYADPLLRLVRSPTIHLSRAWGLLTFASNTVWAHITMTALHILLAGARARALQGTFCVCWIDPIADSSYS